MARAGVYLTSNIIHMPLKYLLIGAALLASSAANARETFAFLGKTVVLEDSLGAGRANLRSDDYTRSHTDFDRSIRLNRTTDLTETAYLNLAAKNMRNWNAEELAALRKSMTALADSATAMKLRLPLPDTLVICKTRGEEELGAEGYTRGNRIMLHASLDELTPALLAHELWHVISRLNQPARDRAYAGFGFRPCNRVDYKPAFGGRVISNPDCPFIEHYLRMNVAGKDEDVAIVLYSRSPFVKGGGLMDYVAVKLLQLEGSESNKKVVLSDGKPVVHGFGERPDFFKQVGRNTPYMLHIEELTAEHFSALMTGRRMPEPQFVDRLAASFR